MSTSFGVRSLDIGGPSGQVWGVNTANQAFYRPFASPVSPGGSWTAVLSFPAIFFTQIAIGGGNAAGDVFGLGILSNFAGDKYVYYRTGVTNINPSGTLRVRAGTATVPVLVYMLVRVHTMSFARWTRLLTSCVDSIPRAVLTRSARSPGTGWSQLSGQRLNRISVGGGFGGSSLPVVWGCTSSGTVYARTGITSSNRRGSGWSTVSVSPRFTSVSVNGRGDAVYGLSTERVNGGYRIYYQTIGDFGIGWQPLDTGGTQFQGAVSISAF